MTMAKVEGGEELDQNGLHSMTGSLELTAGESQINGWIPNQQITLSSTIPSVHSTPLTRQTSGSLSHPTTSPAMDRARPHQQFSSYESSCRGPLVALIYGTASTSMAFLNKVLMTTYGFNFQFFLMFAQMLFTVVILELLRRTKRVSLPPYSLSRGYGFLVPSFVYAVHSVLALHALSGMNIPMYGVVKRCGPLVTLILSTIILKKGMPTSHVISAIGLMTSGCLIAGYGDLAFDIRAYTFGAISVFTQAFYLVVLQKVSQGHLTALETLHLNSCNTLLPLLFCALALGEVSGSMGRFTHQPSAGFLTSFFCTIMMGSVLNYLLFLCTTLNSALTTSVVGTLKSIVQTAIGMFTFGGVSINFFTVSGISMNLFGGVLYSYTKYVQSLSRKDEKEDTTEDANDRLVPSVGFSRVIVKS